MTGTTPKTARRTQAAPSRGAQRPRSGAAGVVTGGLVVRGLGASALTAGLLIASSVFAPPATAQFSLSIGGEAPSYYASDDGSFGFVLDRSDSRAKVKFDGSEEVIVLDPTPNQFGGLSFTRDDGTAVVSIDSLGLVSVIGPDGNLAGAIATRTTDPLTLEDRTQAQVTATLGEISENLSKTLGAPISITADYASLGSSGAALAAAEHQGYVVAEAIGALALRGEPVGGTLKTVTISGGDRIGAKPAGDTLSVTISPALGHGAGFSSATLASLLEGSFR